MLFYRRRQADPATLVSQFTSEEAIHITRLQGLFRNYAVCYKLEIDYRRLGFARWLFEHGRLDDWGSSTTNAAGAPTK